MDFKEAKKYILEKLESELPDNLHYHGIHHTIDVYVKLTELVLPKFGYNEKQIKTIGEIILTTRIKARPQSLLEKIMCDADYDYLGRSDVHHIADTLYRELIEYDVKFSEEEWNKIQLKFLKKHQYHTM